MYTDRALFRIHTFKVRLNQEENALVDALVGYLGEQKAALMRELMMKQVRIELELAQQADPQLRVANSKGPN